MSDQGQESTGKGTLAAVRRRRWYLLLVPPFVGTLWVPFYNSVEPTLGGVPFFYWYQLVWILVGAVLTATVYFATREDG